VFSILGYHGLRLIVMEKTFKEVKMLRKGRFIVIAVIIMSLVLSLVLTLGGCKAAPEAAPTAQYKIRVGTAQTPAPGWAAAEKIFKPLAETKSDGRISIDTYGNAVLGSAKEQLDMVSDGSLELAYATTLYLTRYIPWMDMFDLPFNCDSPTEFLELSLSILPAVNEELAASDMVIVGMPLIGTRSFFGNKLIRTPEDCKGLIFRYHAAGVGPKFCEQYGGKPVVFGWSEIYTAFEQGTIDVTTCCVPVSAIAGKIYEVTDYLSVSKHVYVTCCYIANRTWLNGLPTDIREILLDSMEVAVDWGTAELLRREETAYEELATKYGVEVYYMGYCSLPTIACADESMDTRGR